MSSTTCAQEMVADGRSVSECLIAAIAAQEGTDAADLDPPVYEIVDPDALDAVFRRGSVDGRIQFSFEGYEVVVRNGDPPRVTVEPADR